MRKKVLAFGTFDIIHPGHIAYLEKARAYGDELIVVVGRDEVVRSFYNKKPFHTQKERLKMVQSLKMVTQAVLGYKIKKRADYLRIIKKIKPSVLCFGYDEKLDEAWLARELAKNGLENITIKRIRAFKPGRWRSRTSKRRAIPD